MERKTGHNSKTIKNRLIGLDCLKIVMCWLIVAVHTIDGRLGTINRVLQLMPVIAIPMFFAINGYLVLSKEEITFKYITTRIIKILIICFTWEFLFSALYYVTLGKRIDFLKGFVLDFVQQGNFFQFWFLGSLIILYIITPILNILLKTRRDIYTSLTILLGGVCVAIDLIQYIIKYQFIRDITQTFRLWIWLLYYMAGGLIASLKKNGYHMPKILTLTRLFCLSTVALFSSMGWIWFCRNKIFGYVDIAAYYGSLPVIIASLGFLLFSVRINMNVNKCFKRWVYILASSVMGVYILHPDIMSYWAYFFPAMKESALLNIAWWIVTIVSTELTVIIMGKIPVIKELVKI